MLTALLAAVTALAASVCSLSLPVVDLGYAVHQATVDVSLT